MTRRVPFTLLASLLLALLAAVVLLPASSARADDQGDREIIRFAVDATAQADGTIDVRQEIDFDFATTPGHGLFLTLITRQEIAGDPDHYRVLEISDVEVSSPTGAPADMHLDEGANGLVIRIGDEDIDDVSGVQTYVVEYTVAGVPNSGVGVGGEDEIYWNVIGSAFEVPISNVTVRLTGPALPEEVACYTGRVGSKKPCSAYRVSDGVATFEQHRLGDGQGMSVVVSYPGGTFGGVEPILEPRRTFANGIGLGTPVVPAAGAFAVLAVGGVAAFARRRGRDIAYQDLTPGLVPVGGGGRVGPRKKQPIAVQFTPPEGVLPGEMGTLTDERADRRDVTATVFDLAVRGYLRIEEIEGKKNDWRMIRNLDADWDELQPFERTLLRSIFHTSGEQKRMSKLGKRFAEGVTDTQEQLYEEMVNRGWFKRSPRTVRTSWIGMGILLVVVGVVATLLLSFLAGWGLLGVPVILGGVAVLVSAPHAPARTADGSAVLAQALGFKKYIETAEARTLQFEANEDIFSKYLPYAMTFGLESRWVAIFAEYAKQGGHVPNPTWYSGHSPSVTLWSSGFGEAVSSFTSAADIAVATATTSSSSGSGFSGGGGYSGGGVGGGGGGGW